MTIVAISQQLQAGSLSPVELTSACLTSIEKLNPALNAFVTVTAESALAEAREAEREIRQGRCRGFLHGIPLGLKDLIDTAGVRTTAASALLKDRVPIQDAEAVRHLKAAGAVLLGKHNLHEFAYGGSSLISYFGEPHNPWNFARITGGSSGGSAAAVAAGLGFGAIGTDTAGSIREPASLCGVVGLKPTYGAVNARGVIPLSPSLDHVGPITSSVEDAALIFQAIAEPRMNNPRGVLVQGPDFLDILRQPFRNIRIAVPRRFFFEELDSDVAAAVEEALWVIRKLNGAALTEISLAVSTDRTLQAAESYQYHREWVSRSPQLYYQETLRRIRTGEGIPEAQLEGARNELSRIRQEIARLFDDFDVLITPTTPIPAPDMAELKEKPDQLRPREMLLLRNTRPVNVWGLPAISIPCGFTGTGLPIGLQVIGPHWGEAKILQLAYAYEQATEWHNHRPPIHAESLLTPVSGRPQREEA